MKQITVTQYQYDGFGSCPVPETKIIHDIELDWYKEAFKRLMNEYGIPISEQDQTIAAFPYEFQWEEPYKSQLTLMDLIERRLP